MSEDNTVSLPRIEEMDEKDKTDNEAKDGLMENLNENSEGLCSNVLQNESEKSEHVYLLPTENKEKLSLTSASNCGPKILFISERQSPERNARLPSPDYESPLDLSLNIRANKIELYENESVKAIQEIVKPKCIAEIDILGAYKIPSFIPGSDSDQKKKGFKFSHLIHEKGIKGCGMSMEERKWVSFNRDTEFFLGPLVPSTENVSSNNTNVSRTSSFLVNSDELLLNEESNNEMIGPLGDPRDDNIPTEAHPQDQINSREMSLNKNEPTCPNKSDDAVAGPAGTCSSKQNHACHICPKKFKRKSNLKEGKRIHTGKKPFVCDICKKEFTWKVNRDNHYRTHTGEKPFVCDLCGNAFARKDTLTLHIRTHTGDKPFVCDLCGNSFARKDILTLHIRTHTGGKPFVCDLCGNAFARKDVLTVHIRRHTGDKPFVCDVCGKSFAQKSTLIRHIRIHRRKTL